MDWWLFTFFLGAILALLLPITPLLYYVFCLLFVAIFLFANKKLRCITGFFFGCAWLLLNGIWYDNALPDAFLVENSKQDKQLNQVADLNDLVSKTLIIKGEVITIPVVKQNNKGLRFNFKATHFNQVELQSDIVLRLSWDHSSTQNSLAQGQIWQLKVKIKPAHGFANPGGFSYQTWLRQKNIVATGYVVNAKSTKVSAVSKKEVQKNINGEASKNHLVSTKAAANNILLENTPTIRQQLLEQLRPLLPQHELAPLLLALSFGERSQISTDLWTVLQATGTQHLIAISGLHLGLVASSVFILISLLIRTIPVTWLKSGILQQNLLKSNTRLTAILVSCTVTLCYAYLAGFALPTLRALIMLLLYWCSRLMGIKLSLKRWVLLALFVIILLSPFSLISGSFWLSVYAVVIILLIIWRHGHQLSSGNSSFKFNKFTQFIKSLFLIQISLTLAMLPLSAMFNHQLSLVSFFANIIAVPLMSFTSIPLCLLAVLVLPLSEALSTFLLQLAVQSLAVVWKWLSFLTEFQWSVINLSSVDIIALALFVFILMGLWLVIINRYLIAFVLVFLMMIFVMFFWKGNAGVFWQSPSKKQPGWVVRVMDVGQGLSVIIEQGNHFILYDTGASYPSGFNLADAVLLPYFKHRGVKVLDKVIISHSDNDHSGSLNKLKQSINIHEIIANDQSLKGDSFCLQGQEIIWQGLTFSTFWPSDDTASDFGQNNDDSCVIKITDGQFSVLLTGDISKKVERKLLIKHTEQQIDLKSNVLIAPHHGSKTSSSIRFIRGVSPQIVVFSSGYLNRWKMPVTEVVGRYQQANVTSFNTATSGMVEININQQGVEVQQYREDLWPFWFSN